jgi:hypothetical protein
MVLLYLQYFSLARVGRVFPHRTKRVQRQKAATCAIRHCRCHQRQLLLPSKTIIVATPFGIMARALFINPLTNAPCYSNKCLRSKNSQWMHLGAGEVGTWSMIQLIWTRYLMSATNSMFLASYSIALCSR